MKALRPFFLVALLLAFVPALDAAPAESPPEASLWDELFDGVTRGLESVIESVWANSEAPTSEGSGGEGNPTPELWPTVGPVGSPDAYPWAEPVGSTEEGNAVPELWPTVEPFG